MRAALNLEIRRREPRLRYRVCRKVPILPSLALPFVISAGVTPSDQRICRQVPRRALACLRETRCIVPPKVDSFLGPTEESLRPRWRIRLDRPCEIFWII